MSIAYSSITILTSEEARWKGRPLHDSVVNLVRGRRIAARCRVTRAIAGCYESGQVATHSIVDLSTNLPLEIRIVLPAAEAETLLSELEEMVADGMILVEDVRVHSHRMAKRLLPRGVRVRDAMTSSPISVTFDTPVAEVVRLLLQAAFEALTAGQVMTPKPLTVSGDDTLEQAVDRMMARKLKRVPVTDESGRLVDMLSRVDVLRVVADESPK